MLDFNKATNYMNGDGRHVFPERGYRAQNDRS